MPNEPPRKHNRRIGVYDLLEKIGHGGMSTVYKAIDMRTEGVVAIKVASRVVINDPQLSQRFKLEFSVAHPLNHQNLVKVLDFGIHQQIPFLVMEYVDGPSLSKQLISQRKLTEHDALTVVRQVAEALTYLHKKQIFHRDVKPGNILLNSRGEAKLADLGLLKNPESITRLTRSNMGLGTMHFASPEQFDDARDADARSDIYSLAVTLYLILTGEYPFGDAGMMNMVRRKMLNQFDAPISKLPNLSPCVDVAIRLALHADRDQRPASCNEFVALLTGAKKIRPDPDLPGTMPTAAAKPKTAKKTTADRRSASRCEVAFEATFRAATRAVGQCWTSTIRDLSLTGVCLLAKRRFEPGADLEITFATPPDEGKTHLFARVRWIKSTRSGEWLLGCEFINPLTMDELAAILVDQTDKTKVTIKE